MYIDSEAHELDCDPVPSLDLEVVHFALVEGLGLEGVFQSTSEVLLAEVHSADDVHELVDLAHQEGKRPLRRHEFE